MPEAISQGRTIEEVTANVADVLEPALRWRREWARHVLLALT